LAAARVIQGVVGTATVGLVYLVGSLAFGRRAGLTSALLTAIYLPMVYYAGLLLTETWFTFLQMGALALWLRAWAAGPDSVAPEAGPDGGPGPAADHSRTRTVPGLALALAAGLTAGMACLSRAAFVLAVGMLAVGGWFAPPVPMSRPHRVARIAPFLLRAAAVIAPITVRNHQIHGRFYLIS